MREHTTNNYNDNLTVIGSEKICVAADYIAKTNQNVSRFSFLLPL